MTLVLREHEMCNLGRCNFKENKKEYALTTNIQLPYKYLCHQTMCSVINFECLNLKPLVLFIIYMYVYI